MSFSTRDLRRLLTLSPPLRSAIYCERGISFGGSEDPSVTDEPPVADEPSKLGPQTVFDSADAAVRAALALQEAYSGSEIVQRLDCALRVGIHLGEIVEADDGDVYGDGVNIASRIEGQAEAGQVVVSEDVHRALRQQAEHSFKPMGHVNLKGVEEPMSLYVVGAPEGAVPRPEGVAEFAKRLKREQDQAEERETFRWSTRGLSAARTEVDELFARLEQEARECGIEVRLDRPKIITLTQGGRSITVSYHRQLHSMREPSLICKVWDGVRSDNVAHEFRATDTTSEIYLEFDRAGSTLGWSIDHDERFWTSTTLAEELLKATLLLGAGREARLPLD